MYCFSTVTLGGLQTYSMKAKGQFCQKCVGNLINQSIKESKSNFSGIILEVAFLGAEIFIS